MNLLKKIKELKNYMGYNIFAISGWLYLPILIYMINFQNPFHYIWLPLGIFLLLPWIVSILAFIIFLVEQVITAQAKHKVFQNKIYRFMANTGLVIIFLFYVILLVKSLISL